jgi:hypothetical protein
VLTLAVGFWLLAVFFIFLCFLAEVLFGSVFYRDIGCWCVVAAAEIMISNHFIIIAWFDEEKNITFITFFLNMFIR